MKRKGLLLLCILMGFTTNLLAQTTIITGSGDLNTKVKQGFFHRESGSLKYTLTNNEIIAIKLTDSKEKYIKGYLNYELKKKGDHEQNIQLPPDLAPGLYFLTISNLQGEKLKIKITM